ncbi:pirin family protein [Emticicia sp. 21SJ11W-3]|uniref:pirin family protein n=1 Tax=Emticicia sp. 21SJ11W-3 TaxID=2916755 RepID=UPI0020A0378A|nr:pirin family protein [Emticicia sp. 21SJ11W-3]UTA68777.1 pirin family protein [Emticicia sp. 21SJ11W-3]
MKARNIQYISLGHDVQVGHMLVKQPLPARDIRQVSPFLLLHHAVPTYHSPAHSNPRLSPHPHRGFEPVTFLFQGKIHHKDSLGNEGFLNAGDVQWMTSGKGIIHSEGPSAEFLQAGGNFELVQLWVNLPRAHKMTQPKYQHLTKDTMPVLTEEGIEMQLVAGNYKGKTGPASTFSPMLAMMVNFEAGARTFFEIPASYNALIYVLDGQIKTNETTVEKLNMVTFDHEGEGIDFEVITKGKLLLLAGEPIQEPLSTYGPFVMNYPAELKQAIEDYELGRMGVLED